MKRKTAQYDMHKYWGKKPAKDISALIQEYSKVGDCVLDPFSGYGVFVCEAYLQSRNAIGNDLNPFANFVLADEITKPLRLLLSNLSYKLNLIRKVEV